MRSKLTTGRQISSSARRPSTSWFLALGLLASLLLASCAPMVTFTLEPQTEAGIQVVQIPANTEGSLQVELRDGRSFTVPPGHFPPPGECRIWQPELPPGRQSPPGPCDDLVTRVPEGAVLLRR